MALPWTKLENTSIFEKAKKKYFSDPRRKYHNWDHILRLYYHAESTLYLDYDFHLDLAILCHDIVYDECPDKELRSIEWMKENFRLQLDHDPVSDHITKTIDHNITHDNRMVLLDLLDLAFPMRREINKKLILEESKLLYGITDKEFSENNLKFFEKMKDNYSEEKLENFVFSSHGFLQNEKYWFRQIRYGINRMIYLSKEELGFHK